LEWRPPSYTQMSNTPQWKNTFTSLFEKMNPQACQLVYIIIIINNLSCCNFIRGVFVPFLNPISMLHACNLFTHTPLHFSWYMYSSSHISSYINNKVLNYQFSIPAWMSATGFPKSQEFAGGLLHLHCCLDVGTCFP